MGQSIYPNLGGYGLSVFGGATGRGATYVIAASDATATEIAQADYVSTTGDLPAAVTAALTAGAAEVKFSSGNFYADEITLGSTLKWSGMGDATILHKIISPDTTLASNANSGQADIVVTSATGFTVGMVIVIRDTAHFEPRTIQGIVGTTITLTQNLTYSYTTAASARAHREFDFITATSKTGIEISNMKIQSDLSFVLATTAHVSGSVGFTIALDTVTKSSVHDVHFYNLEAVAIEVKSSSDVQVFDNTIDTIGDGPIYIPSSSRVQVMGNNIRNYGCAAIYPLTSTEIVVANNIITNGDNSGAHAIVLDGTSYSTVTGNVIKLTRLEGILVTKQNSGSPSTYNTVSNNVVEDTKSEGILVTGATTVHNTVNGNVIKGCAITSTTGGLTFSSATDNLAEGNITTANYVGIWLATSQRNFLVNNEVTLNQYHGLYLQGSSHNEILGGLVVDNDTAEANMFGIQILASGGGANADYNHISGVKFYVTNAAQKQNYGIYVYGVNEGSNGATGNVIENNFMRQAGVTGAIYDAGSGTVIRNNQGYIGPGETQSFSGTLVPTGTCTATTVTGTFTESPLSLKPGANTMTCTVSGTINVVMPAGSTAVVTSGDSTVTGSPKTCAAGATTLVTVTTGAGADTFTITVHSNAFAWHNPVAQDILIKKIVLNRTAAGGTATAEINVGIADNGTVDDPGAEFFENLLANNAAAIHDSYVAAGTSYGTQTIWVNCQDSVSATGGWVVGKIDTEIVNSLAGSYYIEYIGK